MVETSGNLGEKTGTWVGVHPKILKPDANLRDSKGHRSKPNCLQSPSKILKNTHVGPLSLSPTYAGHAGEHLVCFDFISRGFLAQVNSFPGAPYDVIVDLGGGEIIRVQVKTTLGPQERRKAKLRCQVPWEQKSQKIKKYRVERAYRFHSGGKQKGRYSQNKIDLFAFVALDLKSVLYVSAAEVGGKKLVGPSVFAERANGSLDRFLAKRLFS